MKKILAIALLALVATTAAANPRCCYDGGHNYNGGHGHGGHNYNGGRWVAPFIIGAIVADVVIESRRPTVIMQSPVIADPSIVYINGIMYSRQIVFNNGVYQEILVQVYTVNGNYGR